LSANAHERDFSSEQTGHFATTVPPSWYALPLRLIVGFRLIEHGYAKLACGADGFIAILHALGTPFADLLGWATLVVETGGGTMILLGALVAFAAVPMIIVLLVATFTVHFSNGFGSIKLLSYDAMGAHFGQPGCATDLLYIAGCWHFRKIDGDRPTS
jgi:putative oxidoreductase